MLVLPLVALRAELGLDAQSTWDGAVAGRSGVDWIQAFDAKIKKVSEADERLRGLVEVDRRKLIGSFRLRWGDGSP